MTPPVISTPATSGTRSIRVRAASAPRRKTTTVPTTTCSSMTSGMKRRDAAGAVGLVDEGAAEARAGSAGSVIHGK